MATERETIQELRGQVATLTRSLGAVNARLASIDTGSGLGVKRKILELDQRLAAIERGESLAALLASKPYSD